MWYSEGTVAVTNGGTNVTGTGTSFLTNARVGDGITITGSTALHEIIGVTSNSQLSIRPAYAGTTGSGRSYGISPLLGYDKDLSDAFNQLRLQFGDQLSNLQPWATANTVQEARTSLGASESGNTVFTGTPAQAREALGITESELASGRVWGAESVAELSNLAAVIGDQASVADVGLFELTDEGWVQQDAGKQLVTVDYKEKTLEEALVESHTPFSDIEDIRDPALQGNVEDFKLFSMTAREELTYQTSAQNPGRELPALSGTILGECYFGMPTMDQTHKVASPFPRINAAGRKVANASFGGSQTIALSDIRATTFNSSVNLPLFEPVMVDQYGIVSFRYLGEQPLHTVIRGGMQWLQRIHTGAVETTAALDAWLRLSPLPLGNRPSSGLEEREGMPAWEAGGQARGRQYLGFCAASGARHFPLIAEEWNDVPGQISPIVEAAIENDPELNTEPPINGWLSSSSDDSDVLDPDDPDGNTPPELEGNLKTTEWVDITPGTWYRGAVLPQGESSSRGRAQWRDGEGVIHFKDLRSGNFLFQAPADAVDFRIYYAGPQDAHVTGLSIKSVTEGQIREQLVTRGTWRRYNINVCRDVVFYPNTVYRLEILPYYTSRTPGESSNFWFEYEDGYRIESGGLSFMFDASALVKQRAKLHDDRGGN